MTSKGPLAVDAPKTAVAYPMRNRLCTGMALAMLSLVVFTLTVLSVIIGGNALIFSDTDTLTGGYHVQVGTGYANPIHDNRGAFLDIDGLSTDDFEAIGSFVYGNVDVRQEGSDSGPVDWWVRGLDPGHTNSTSDKFAMTAEGYDSRLEVWQALQEEPGTAVVAAGLVPRRSNYYVGDSGLDFSLEGFFLEDDALPQVYIQALYTRTGNEERLRVIAARSVVERRQQIGVLRALGFQKSMVQLSFLLESSFVALLSIAMGVVLGMALSYNLVVETREDIEGFTFSIPWANILVAVSVAYGASLLTTFLPARQAAKVYPAEALRFD